MQASAKRGALLFSAAASLRLTGPSFSVQRSLRLLRLRYMPSLASNPARRFIWQTGDFNVQGNAQE